MTRTAAGPRTGRARLFVLLGPAFVAAIAYVDPGNVAANLTAGARFGYLLVWVLVAANAMAVLVQYLSAKLGVVTAANAGAVALLGRAKPHGRAASWYWLFFLVMLGPIWIGRLDGLLAPIILVALLIAVPRPALAMALATVGAWIKIAPGAVALALAATASNLRAFVRNVVLPGAAVCAVVVGFAFAGGGQANVLDVFGEQGDRQLQVEAVAATPFTVARIWDPSITVEYDDVIYTYEVLGGGAGRPTRSALRSGARRRAGPRRAPARRRRRRRRAPRRCR